MTMDHIVQPWNGSFSAQLGLLTRIAQLRIVTVNPNQSTFFARTIRLPPFASRRDGSIGGGEELSSANTLPPEHVDWHPSYKQNSIDESDCKSKT